MSLFVQGVQTMSRVMFLQVYNRAAHSFGQHRGDCQRSEQAMGVLEQMLLARYDFFQAKNNDSNVSKEPRAPNYDYFVQRRREARSRNMRNE